MIQQEKYQNALRAMGSILTRARWMAHEANSEELADLLDAVEVLPKYIAQPEDATSDFRDVVQDISQQFELCSHIIAEFDQDCVCAW